MKEINDIDELQHFLAHSVYGDRAVYYRGDLARDRGSVLALGLKIEKLTLAKKCYNAYELGLCTLFQKRNNPHDYEYIIHSFGTGRNRKVRL